MGEVLREKSPAQCRIIEARFYIKCFLTAKGRMPEGELLEGFRMISRARHFDIGSDSIIEDLDQIAGALWDLLGFYYRADRWEDGTFETVEIIYKDLEEILERIEKLR